MLIVNRQAKVAFYRGHIIETQLCHVRTGLTLVACLSFTMRPLIAN